MSTGWRTSACTTWSRPESRSVSPAWGRVAAGNRPGPARDPAESAEPQVRHQLRRRSRTGAAGADGRGRGAVADQVYARVLRHLRSEPPGHDDPAVRLTEHERRQVIERT